MKKVIVFALLALFFTTSFANALSIISRDQSSSRDFEVQTTYSSVSGLSLSISLNNLVTETKNFDSESYSKLYWNNSAVDAEVGSPNLPVYRFFVEIPWESEVIASASPLNTEENSLSELGLAQRVFPVQPPREKVEGAIVEFALNSDVYASNSFTGDIPVEVEDYFVLRGRRYAIISVHPVDYRPSDGMLHVITDMDISLDFTGGDIAATRANIQRYSTPYYNKLANRISLNHGVFTDELDELNAPVGMTFIVPDDEDIITAIEELAEWRRQMGYTVTIANVADIGTSATLIKTYIENQYLTADVPPSFVLLIGDTNQLPYFVGQGVGTPDTDLNYGCVDGNDYVTDIGISRFPSRTMDHLNNMIDKTLQFQQVTWQGYDGWETHTSFMAGEDNYNVSEGTHNYVIDAYIEPNDIDYDQIYMVTYGGTTADVSAAFNDGRGYATYSGHGGTYSWADGPPFEQNHVRALTNDVYPWVQSYACITGTFTADECFAETWVRDDHGAVAFMGSSVNSYWDEDDLMERAVFDSFFENPDEDYNLSWINGMINYGKLALMQNYGNTQTVRRYFEMYNIMGDGSVDVWTDQPNEIQVTHDPILFLGDNEVSVEVSGVVDFGLVCARFIGDENIAAASYIDENGIASLTLDPAPTAVGELQITVTGHNLEPYIATIPVQPADGPYCVADSFAVDDEDAWYPNERIDHGETVNLGIRLANVGIESAADIEVTISSESEFITILDDNHTYGTINAGESTFAGSGFEIEVAEETPDGTEIPVIVTATSGDNEWVSQVNLPVHAPVLAINNISFTDINGNNNNWLDPGESADMMVVIDNLGSTHALNLVATLSSEDQFLTLLNDESGSEVSVAGSTDTLYFTINANPSTPQEYTATLNLNYTSDHGYTNDEAFDIVIGNQLYLPSGPDNYGYSAYDLYDAPFAPIYNWVELSADSAGPGTEIVFTQDDQTFQYDLPFDFMYYGVNYNEYSIGANGWIAMGEVTLDDYSNSGIPDDDGPEGMIAPYWEDLSPQRTSSGGVWQWYDEDNHRLIIEFNHVEQYNPSNAFETFQVILLDPAHYESATGDGMIIFQYGEMSTSSQDEGTVGIENPDENDGIEYFFDGAGIDNGMPVAQGTAILFTTGGVIDPEPPSPFGLTSPENGATFTLSQPVEFTWENSYDPDERIYYSFHMIHGDDVYEIFDIVDSFLTIDPDTCITGLQHNDELIWYVVANSSNPEAHVECDARFTLICEVDAVKGKFDGMPEEFGIAALYPNPFNPSTNIVVGLPTRADLRVEVYNIMGRSVATLANRHFEAGYHKFIFDGNNLASGIYFVRSVVPGELHQMNKIILVK